MNLFRIRNIFTLFIIIIPFQIYLPTGIAAEFTLAKFLSYILFFWIIFRFSIERKEIKLIPLDIFLILWLIIRFISFTQSPDLKISFEEIKSLFFFFAVYLTTIYAIDANIDIKFHIRNWLYISFVIAVFGIYQIFKGTSGIISFRGLNLMHLFNGSYIDYIMNYETQRWMIGSGFTRIVGTFWDPNYYCQYLGFCLPIAMSMTIHSTTVKERFIYGLGTVLLIINVIFTFSKSGWICLALMTIILTIFYTRKLYFIKTILIESLLVLPIFLFLVYYLYSGYSIFDLPLKAFRTGFQEDPRIQLWLAFWEQIWEHPIVGHGYYAANVYLPHFYKPFLHAHNVYLQLAFSIGFIGLAVFLVILILFFRMAYFLYKDSHQQFEKGLALGLIGCFFWFIIGNATQDSLFMLKNGMSFWFILGITASLYSSAKERKLQGKEINIC